MKIAKSASMQERRIMICLRALRAILSCESLMSSKLIFYLNLDRSMCVDKEGAQVLYLLLRQSIQESDAVGGEGYIKN
jgi:hypothetical protein